ncbi:MAG: DUF4491 family protein [Ruminococcaceae bacterium]|nr:DUF4491 family protein [Oscillospiraceae bacterium]
MKYIEGLIIGAIAFIMIGVWHPIVIKGEYYLGKKKCIVLFALCGIIASVASVLLYNFLILSFGCGIFAFSAFWGIHEVIQQEKRVNRGWFPSNPKKEKKTDVTSSSKE